jgi:hypothetical protein
MPAQEGVATSRDASSTMLSIGAPFKGRTGS